MPSQDSNPQSQQASGRRGRPVCQSSDRKVFLFLSHAQGSLKCRTEQTVPQSTDVCQLIQDWSISPDCLTAVHAEQRASAPEVQVTVNLLNCQAVAIFGTSWVHISALRPTFLMHLQIILRFENCTGFWLWRPALWQADGPSDA